MDPGYEMPPSRIGRPVRWRAVAVLLATGLFLAIVVIKPWAAPTSPSSNADGAVSGAPSAQAIVPARTVAPSRAGATPRVDASPNPTAIPTSPWPAAATGPAPIADDRAEGAGAIRALAAHAGTWGVGDAGFGPRLLRDELWVGWEPVAPEPASDTPTEIEIWPGTGICSGLPILDDQPSFIALTSPVELAADRQIVGWWSDGVEYAALAGSIRLVASDADPGIRFLVRTDGEPWPAGRYEFHVVAGARTVALGVCLSGSA